MAARHQRYFRKATDSADVACSLDSSQDYTLKLRFSSKQALQDKFLDALEAKEWPGVDFDDDGNTDIGFFDMEAEDGGTMSPQNVARVTALAQKVDPKVRKL